MNHFRKWRAAQSLGAIGVLKTPFASVEQGLQYAMNNWLYLIQIAEELGGERKGEGEYEAWFKALNINLLRLWFDSRTDYNHEARTRLSSGFFVFLLF